jgi:hypothetical protein
MNLGQYTGETVHDTRHGASGTQTEYSAVQHTSNLKAVGMSEI